jgi:hypothetical protein
MSLRSSYATHSKCLANFIFTRWQKVLSLAALQVPVTLSNSTWSCSRCTVIEWVVQPFHHVNTGGFLLLLLECGVSDISCPPITSPKDTPATFSILVVESVITQVPIGQQMRNIICTAGREYERTVGVNTNLHPVKKRTGWHLLRTAKSQ